MAPFLSIFDIYTYIHISEPSIDLCITFLSIPFAFMLTTVFAGKGDDEQWGMVTAATATRTIKWHRNQGGTFDIYD